MAQGQGQRQRDLTLIFVGALVGAAFTTLYEMNQSLLEELSGVAVNNWTRSFAFLTAVLMMLGVGIGTGMIKPKSWWKKGSRTNEEDEKSSKN